MKKFLFLAVCFVLSTVNVCAQRQRTFDYLDYDSVKVVAKTADGRHRLLFGLTKNEEQLLPIEYELVTCRDLGLLAFFKGEELYLYSKEGNLVLRQELDFVADHRTDVAFEKTNYRNNETLYELVVYYFDSGWGGQSIGTFCRQDKRLYKVKITKEYTLIE